MARGSDDADGPVVLFDGHCNLCNGAVRFVLEHDAAGTFRFAALQSEAGARLLRGRGQVPASADPESVVLVEGPEVHWRSDAALRIARRLDGAWPLAYGLVVVPRFIRDAIYRAVARRRYRWFGRTEVCRLSEPGHAGRFLT
jgi:predicted DCC family thiol-disulfide oxidoreductase YuxK